MKSINAAEIKCLDTGKVLLLDIRSREEFERNGIKGSVNVPFDQISSGLSKLPKDKPVYVPKFEKNVLFLRIKPRYSFIDIKIPYIFINFP